MYVDPAERAAAIEFIGDTLWELARAAEAGSDAQFQFVKFFASLASTSAHTEVLRGLREGTITLPGLEIDTDLSWELLEGLVLTGAAGDAEITAALAEDETANGQQAAARIRATIPTVEGKRAAFALVADDDKLPNAIVRNITLGFGHVNDPSSLEPLVAPYFDAIATIWKDRSYSIAQSFVVGLYPAALASQELVDATQTWLDANPEVPALRRLVIENLAGVERALKAQQRDAS
jgi:aminopeptidase N